MIDRQLTSGPIMKRTLMPAAGTSVILGVGALLASVLIATGAAGEDPAAPLAAPIAPIETVPGMPPVADARNLYSETGPTHLSPSVGDHLERVYVPNLRSNDVYVIDPASMKVVDKFKVGIGPQHIVPSWDMQTLWVANNAERRPDGSLTPVNPRTGKPGTSIAVDDPYNLYFTPDGTRAIVVPEKFSSLDFRDPHTWALIKRVKLPCLFPNHMDFTADGSSLVVSCEGSGQLVRVDVATMEVAGVVPAGKSPQDIRLSADGKVFYVADQDLGGVEIMDAATLQQLSFLPTGAGTHGMYPSRDAKQLYVSNRLAGTISVIDYASRQIVATWPVPGGSPDMGGVSADGSQLWLSGRYNSEIYVINTATGALKRIPVGKGPHGLCLFPQPGRISLGHTGNYR